MTALLYLLPAALFLGLLGLVAFLWALKNGQFDDLEGAAHRILFDDDEPERSRSESTPPQGPVGMPSRVTDQRKGDDQT